MWRRGGAWLHGVEEEVSEVCRVVWVDASRTVWVVRRFAEVEVQAATARRVGHDVRRARYGVAAFGKCEEVPCEVHAEEAEVGWEGV